MGSGIPRSSARRLLFGMGRANALPRAFFGSVSARNNIPRNNVLLLGLITRAARSCYVLKKVRNC